MVESDIRRIEELLLRLPDEYIGEVEDFLAFLIEREKKRRAFEERVLSAEGEETTVFPSAEEALKAIVNEAKKD